MAIVSLMIGTCFTMLGLDDWNDNISGNVVVVFSLFFIVMSGANLCCRKIRIKKLAKKNEIHFNENVIIFVSIIAVLMTAMYGFNAYKIGMMYGATGINAFAYMKNAYSSNSSDYLMNPVIRQFFKVVMAISYVNGFIFVKKLIKKEKSRVNIYCLISILCGVLITVFSGSRTEIMRIFSALLLSTIVIRRNGVSNSVINKKSQKEIIKKVVPVAGFILVILFGTRSIVKVSDVATSGMDSMLDYIIYYFGSPLEVFNIKLSYLFKDGTILWGSAYALSCAGTHEYLGYKNYGGNVATVFQNLFYRGLVKALVQIFIVFWVMGSMYKTIAKVSDTGLNEYGVVLFSGFYFVSTISFYANCFSMATNISSLLTLFLICVYLCALRRIKI